MRLPHSKNKVNSNSKVRIESYAGDRFALLYIDLRSMKENYLHSSEMRLVNRDGRRSTFHQ